MPISKSILGMNARNFLYIRKYNLPSAKRRADDKLATKRLLLREKIPTADVLHAFFDRKSVTDYDWRLPKEGFVVKPARGYGGEGILVFTSWNDGQGETVAGQTYTKKQLESHILDIFEGAYSLQYLPDVAYIEELIRVHPFFRKLNHIGLPDVRVIVFNKVPVMAMLRLPTEESKGKANLHLGAIALGIDLRTGITNHAIYKDRPITFLPGTKIKTKGIKIPFWDEILKIAAQGQVASRLGYAGVDVVVDVQKGPLVLEINSRPGLRIQNANLASLRSRLERVENLNITTVERGIEVAKSLFAEEFSEKVTTTQPKILSVIEKVILHGNNGIAKECDVKIDSGAYRSSIDKSLVDQLQLPLLPRKIFISAASGQQYRTAVRLEFTLKGKKVTTIVTVADRSHLKYQVIIGRRDLKGFLINPDNAPEQEDYLDEELSEESTVSTI